MTTSPLPSYETPGLGAVFAQLGEPTAEFRPATSNILAWMIVAGFLALAGLAALGFAGFMIVRHGFDLPLIDFGKNQPDWARAGILTMAGVSFTVFGLFWARVKWRQLSGRVFLCPGGLVNARPGKIEVFRWEDVERIVQDYAESKKPGDPGPPMAAGTGFRVDRRDGVKFGFTRDTLKQHRQLARLLFAEAQARGIPWEFYTGD